MANEKNLPAAQPAQEEPERYEVAEIAAGELSEMFGQGFDIKADLTQRRTSYCSFTAEDKKSKAFLFNISNQTPEAIGDHIGEVVEITDVYIEMITMHREDDLTGEVTTVNAPRTVLITKDGKGYGCVSVGMYSAVKRLFDYFGEPGEWDEPIKVKFKQINRNERRLFTFEVV